MELYAVRNWDTKVMTRMIFYTFCNVGTTFLRGGECAANTTRITGTSASYYYEMKKTSVRCVRMIKVVCNNTNLTSVADLKTCMSNLKFGIICVDLVTPVMTRTELN